MTVAAKTHTAKLRPRRSRAFWMDDPGVRLMLRIQADDEEAFGQLVQEYWSLIYGRCFRQLGDRQEAEDLAQEVFLRLFRHRKRYRPRARLSTLLFHITQNALSNAHRTRMRRPALRLELSAWANRDDLPIEKSLIARDESPSARMERAELVRSIRTAVADLGGRQRTALELHQFHDHSYAEIAAQMRMTPKAAKSLLYRARIQLRSRLLALMNEA